MVGVEVVFEVSIAATAALPLGGGGLGVRMGAPGLVGVRR